MPRTKSVWLTNHITICPNLKEAKKMLGNVSEPILGKNGRKVIWKWKKIQFVILIK